MISYIIPTMDPNAPITFQPQQTWDVLDAHFKDSSVLVEAQVLSYENMINIWLPQLLQQSGFEVYSKDKSSKVKFEVIKCAICKPTQYVNRQGNRPLSPRDARNNNITYSAKLYLDFAVTLTTSGNKTERWVETRVLVCGIPAMIKSSVCHLHGRSTAETTALGECPYDLGGYFIVSGSEKVIISQERPVENIITVFPENDASKPYIGRAEVKSSIDQRFFPIKTTVVKLAKTMALHVFLPHGRNSVPLGVVFKALGVISDKQIMEYLMDYEDEFNVDLLNVMTATIEESKLVLTQNDALRLVSNAININIDPKDAGDQIPDDLTSNFRMTFAANLLNREFLPHVGNDPDKKLKFIALMVKHLLDAYRDESKYTDRDKLTNKRLNLAGPLLAQIFSHWWGNTVKEIKLTFARSLSDSEKSSYPQDVRRILQKSNIEKKLNYCLSTGNWFTTRSQANSASKKGIAQVLQRMSATGTISHLRRLSSPLERSGSKHEPPRRLHGTQVPKICPNETPEGAQVGTVKNLALLTHVSSETNAEPAAYCLRRLGMLLIEDVSPMHQHKMTKVIVNGQLLGLIETTQKTNDIYRAMRYFKRTGIINKYISVSWLHDEMTLKIFTDGGRYMVPYFIVDEDNHLVMDLWVNAASAAGIPFETLGLTELSSVMPEAMSQASARMYTEPFNADKSSSSFKLHKQAAVEYLDTDEDETCMLADTVERLYDGQTFRPGADDSMLYAHLTRSLKDTDDTLTLVEQIISQVKANRPDMVQHLTDVLEDAVIFNTKTRECRLTLTVSYSRLTAAQRLAVTNLNRFLSGCYIRYTHCLVHPSQINGVVATNIPFSDHNPSPRNCYQSSMGKQALGIFMTNYETRWDTMGNILIYPQVPIAACRTAKYAGLDRLHHGATVMLAINTYSGYNQEDSLIGNKDAAKRGCFNNLFYRTYTSRLRRITTTQNDAVETFEVPPAEGTIGRKMGMLGKNRYHAIVTNPVKGKSPELPALGTIVEGGDVIIPKSRRELKDRTKKGGPYVYSDNSTTVRPSEGGVVDKIIPSEEYPNNEDEEGYRIVKVRLCELRQPEIGDKFASRAAQKGTEGIQYNTADICQTQDGVRPEKIMNPHAIPSRMTLGQLLEAKCAKYGVMTGTYMDTTPFTEFNNDELSDKFKQLGYDYACDELMYNGFTGDMLGLVSITPTYYQRLKHMVADKIHARALGPIQSLTKQPAEGRARGGGLRIGEMERDSLLAHGAVMTLKEKLCDSSDIAEFYVSREKQVPISANPKLGIFQHGNEEVYEDDIRRVHMPYAMELLRKEMVQGMINMQYNFTA